MTKTLGNRISELRKQKDMTQLELANKMNVTDKAVSKWERDLSCPDIHSISRLSEILEVSIEELMSSKRNEKTNIKSLVMTIFKAIGLAMGVSATVLLIMGKVEMKEALILLSIGLSSLAISYIDETK